MLPVLYDQEYGKWKWHDRAPKWHTTTRRFMVNYHLLIVKEGEATWRINVMQTFHDRIQLGGEEDSYKYT